MSYNWSKRSLGIISTTSKYLQMCADDMIKESAIDAYVEDWGGYRTIKIQQYLHGEGWSNADGVKKLSYHQKTDEEGKGMAIDICAYFEGKKNYNYERLMYLSMLFRQIWHRNKKLGKIPSNLYLHSGILFSKDKNTKDGMGWDRPHHAIKKYPQTPTII